MSADGETVWVRITEAYDRRPCDRAVVLDYLRLDQRTVDDPAKIEFYKGDTSWWYDEGQNHRVSPEGRIQRDVPDKAWFVEVHDWGQLQELMALYGWVLTLDDWVPGGLRFHEL